MEKYRSGAVFVSEQKGAKRLKIVVDKYDSKNGLYAVRVSSLQEGKSFGHIVALSEKSLDECTQIK